METTTKSTPRRQTTLLVGCIGFAALVLITLALTFDPMRIFHPTPIGTLVETTRISGMQSFHRAGELLAVAALRRALFVFNTIWSEHCVHLRSA
jgi:hypothetical protein